MKVGSRDLVQPDKTLAPRIIPLERLFRESFEVDDGLAIVTIAYNKGQKTIRKM
jgi:hypothetical protein